MSNVATTVVTVAGAAAFTAIAGALGGGLIGGAAAVAAPIVVCGYVNSCSHCVRSLVLSAFAPFLAADSSFLIDQYCRIVAEWQYNPPSSSSIPLLLLLYFGYVDSFLGASAGVFARRSTSSGHGLLWMTMKVLLRRENLDLYLVSCGA